MRVNSNPPYTFSLRERRNMDDMTSSIGKRTNRYQK